MYRRKGTKINEWKETTALEGWKGRDNGSANGDEEQKE